MVDAHRGMPMSGIFRIAGDANTTKTFEQEKGHQLDAMTTEDDENAVVVGSTLKRKSFAMSDSPPALPPPTQGESYRAVTSAPAAPGAAAGGGGEEVKHTNSRNRTVDKPEKQQDLSIQVSSVNVGETLRVPLSGKTVPFRVVRRRGIGFSSVVFECEREKEEDGGPPVVTVKVCDLC